MVTATVGDSDGSFLSDSTLGGTYESHTDSSAVATPEPMPLSQFALGDDENKNRFLRCIGKLRWILNGCYTRTPFQ